MDLESRIRRRQRRDGTARLIRDYAALSPVSHVEEPTDRGPVLERLLDFLEPVFDGELPPNGYVWGPPGSGKSAIATALCRHLNQLPRYAKSVIHTTTRAQSSSTPEFIYVDSRIAASTFGFYRELLDGVVEESIPRHGIGTERIRDRLVTELDESDRTALVVVDHVDEQATLAREDILQLCGQLGDHLAWLCIGRRRPEKCGWADVAEERIEVPQYRTQVLVDVVMARGAAGLTRRALDHAQARHLAEWADGNAHDALAALCVAADRAERSGHDRITECDIECATKAVPRPSISLARVSTAPENRRLVLREFVDLADGHRESVTAAAAAISASDRIALSEGTVKRFLYELADGDVLKRVETDRTSGQGRPPSRLEERFPPDVFRRLYDHQR